MGNFKLKHLFVIASIALIQSACLVSEDGGTQTVGSTTTTPPDFTTLPGDDNNGLPDDPAPTPTPTPPANIPGYAVIPNEEVDLIVNDGDLYTNEANLNLQMIAPPMFYSRMKISYLPDCSDGVWESFSEEVSRPVPHQNAVNAVGVRYMDDDLVVSQCVVKPITHDNLPPEVIISKYPMASLEEGRTAALSYSVTDASPIASVKCMLNQLERPCGPGNVDVNITALPEGNYTFSVEASDILGQSARQEVSWSVVRTTKHLLQSVIVKPSNDKVDVLIVDDNSGSMEYEQKSMAARTSNFLQILRGLNWRIAVTTTDPSSTSKVNGPNTSISKYSDGLFLPISGLSNQYYIDSSMNENDAQERLGKTLQRSETGSGSEQAIYATYRSIERAFTTNNPVQKNFFRDGAHLAVLVISDEDESANGSKNNPENLLSLVNTKFNGQKAFSWHSIITKPGDTACRNTYGAAYGDRYNAFSTLTGGLIGSVCESDYGAQLMGVASKIRQLVKTMTLTCLPLPQFPIEIKRDGVVYSGTYTVEGVNLNFADELPAGSYTVDYHCLQ